MCISVVLNSLDHSPATRSYVIRMLMLFATQTTLCSDQPFIDWFLGFMQADLPDLFQIKKQLALFVEVCVDFFSAIPPQVYGSNTVKAVFKFFDDKVCQKQLPTMAEREKDKLMKIATMTLNASLALEDELFFLAIIRDIELLWDNLNDQQKELLNVFAEGKVKAFDDLVQKNDYLQKSGINVDLVRLKMQVVTLMSLCGGEKGVVIEDLADQMGIGVVDLLKLAVKINFTDNAKLKIDDAANTIFVWFYQPMLIKPEDSKVTEARWNAFFESMDKSIDTA